MWKVPSRLYVASNVQVKKQSAQTSNKLLVRYQTGGPRKTSGGSSKVLSVGGAAFTVVLGGSIVAAKVSDKFRDWAENTIPGATSLLDAVIGPKYLPPPADTRFPPVPSESGLLKKKLERDALKQKDGLLVITTGGSPKLAAPKKDVENKPEALSTAAEKVEAGTSETPAVPSPPLEEPPTSSAPEAAATPAEEPVTVPPLETEINPENFSEVIGQLHSKASVVVNEAVSAQERAAAAIKDHLELVYRAMEREWEPGQTADDVWSPVSKAAQEKIDAVHVAEERVKEARIAVAQLKEAIAQGIKTNQSTRSPDMITLDETVARALYSLETAKARVAAAQAEAKVMEEYRDLVDTARRHFQTELSSIMPDGTPAFSSKDTKLSEEELNMLLAHAYRKIITLQKEIAKQQSLEPQRLRAALEIQRKEDENLLESRVRNELERQYYELKAQFGHELGILERELSSQFTQQLKRQAAAHSDHLSEMLNTQNQELQRKYESQVEQVLADERLEQHKKLSSLLGLAKGIQEAVHARAENDRMSRQAKELWLAAQSLIEALCSNAAAHNKWEDQRRKLDEHISGLRKAIHSNDAFVSTVVSAIPEDAANVGVLPQGALKERFVNVERVCRRVALVGDNGGSLIRYALSYLQSLIIVRPELRPLPSAEVSDEPVDVEKWTTFDILARARFCLEKDDVEQAARYMSLLRGEPRNVASDWLKDTRMYLEALQAAQALLAYASAVALESM